jgi:hypothetical protein
MKIIEAETLTTFEIAGDGKRVRFNCTDAEGAPVALSLPADCLRQMTMALPHIAQEAFRRLHGDESLRVVYTAGSWQIERDAEEGSTIILTLGTADGFEVSFGFSPTKLGSFEQSIQDAACLCGPMPVLN